MTKRDPPRGCEGDVAAVAWSSSCAAILVHHPQRTQLQPASVHPCGRSPSDPRTATASPAASPVALPSRRRNKQTADTGEATPPASRQDGRHCSRERGQPRAAAQEGGPFGDSHNRRLRGPADRRRRRLLVAQEAAAAVGVRLSPPLPPGAPALTLAQVHPVARRVHQG